MTQLNKLVLMDEHVRSTEPNNSSQLKCLFLDSLRELAGSLQLEPLLPTQTASVTPSSAPARVTRRLLHAK